MNSYTDVSSLLLPALLGLLAGMGHGIVSHNADLPLSLTEQMVQPFKISQSLPQ